jgi:uncharacterized protein DUF1883
MNFIHSRVETEDGEGILVRLRGSEANVMVMRDNDFRSYRASGRFNFYGGHYRQSPVVIRPPQSGCWNVVVDLGGGAGKVEAAVSIIR